MGYFAGNRDLRTWSSASATRRAEANIAVKIALAMDEVFEAAPCDRARAFAGVAVGIACFLAELENGPDVANTHGQSSVRDFALNARIYTRALETYPAASEAWLEVFTAFRQMFYIWTGQAAAPSRLRRAAGETKRPR